MIRREFITLLGGAAAWPLDADAQQAPKLPTIGFLGSGTPSSHGQLVAAFVQRLREIGWAEGRTVAIEVRWAERTLRALRRNCCGVRPTQGRCHRHVRIAVANGDHIYWDLLAPVGKTLLGMSPEALAYSPTFNRSQVVLGGDNETILKRVAGPQIVPVYGNDFRSTPVFFMQDDHDYFDNDEATDEAVTFPPSQFMLSLARATQNMYYPEYLPDIARPLALPFSSAGDRVWGISESFGTVRYGRLAELLLYDVRRTQTMAGPSAVYVDLQVEAWLKARTAGTEITHVVHVPSNPPGWTAGKWGEWYPDVLGDDGKLTVKVPKPYWQPGWLKQHDRLMEAIGAMKRRAPVVMSGDLHAIGAGRMLRSGDLDFKANPITVVLNGPIGCRTGPNGWPSGRRGTGALPPAHLDMDETVKPIEQHGFSIVDFASDQMTVRLFKWDWKTQKVEDIDTLQPFRTLELARPL